MALSHLQRSLFHFCTIFLSKWSKQEAKEIVDEPEAEKESE